jgi:endonuclease III
MALMNRPEHFLKRKSSSAWKPIVDYHDMRITLRLGHVSLPKEWVEENEERRLTSRDREEAVRRATYRADNLLIEESGRTRDEIDVLKWSARRYCPEMETPNCGACILNGVCAQKTKRFQPVIHTTNY